MYIHVRDTVVMLALKEAEFFSATTDLWTSATSEPYMTLTVHFVDKHGISGHFVFKQCLCLLTILARTLLHDALSDILIIVDCQQRI